MKQLLGSTLSGIRVPTSPRRAHRQPVRAALLCAQVVISSKELLREEIQTWNEDSKHWINIRPDASSKLGLAQVSGAVLNTLLDALIAPTLAALHVKMRDGLCVGCCSHAGDACAEEGAASATLLCPGLPGGVTTQTHTHTHAHAQTRLPESTSA